MKIMKVAVVILIVLTFYGCNKKANIEDIMDFNLEDVMYLTTIVSTSDESESLKVSKPEGIHDFIELLKKIKIVKKLDQDTLEKTAYYDYTLFLSVNDYFRLIDYQDKMKIIDREGNESWYEISTSTWDGLTALWKEYYLEQNKLPYPMNDNIVYKKPAIYLYPLETTKISVKLELKGDLIYTYPAYNDGWKVWANPDGSLQNVADGKMYSYLFWEGVSDIEYDMSKGFVVKGSDTTTFLEEKLSYLGLTSKEYNEFIVYWAPEMTENRYNLITFQGDSYSDSAKLTISPEPDSMQRIFMVYKSLEDDIDIPEQELTQWKRSGFSVVEWGGSQVYERDSVK